MSRPLRYPCAIERLDLARWPHAVEVDRRHIRLNARYQSILAAEVEAWLRFNVRRGGWRFAKKIGLHGMPTPEDPCHIIASIQIIFQLHLANEDDAFAFKMRWL